MTEEQKAKLKSLIYRYREAAENLGSIQSSIHFNAKYVKVEALEAEIREFIDSLGTK